MPSWREVSGWPGSSSSRPRISDDSTREFVDALQAEPFQPFTVRADSVSLYQLGDYGTAQRKLHELHRC
jgi:hypothetical protein